jgi:putative mRNA 3-end processing factor
MKRAPEYIRDIDRLNGVFTSSNIIETEQRKELIKEPCIIVTSAGMLNGGPVLYYINEIYDDAKSKIHLTGYQAEDTNGRRALESSYIEDRNRIIHLKCRLELYDFSAHCGDAHLKELVKKFCDNGTETVFPVHGDNTQGFAEWITEELGVESRAPINGDNIYI